MVVTAIKEVSTTTGKDRVRSSLSGLAYRKNAPLGAFLLLLALPTAAAEFDHQEYIGLRGGYELGGLALYAYPFEDYLTQSENGPQWWIYPGLTLDLELGGWFRTLVRVEPGALSYEQNSGVTLNGRKAVDELREQWALRELYLEADLSGDGFSPLRLGKQELNLGRGMVYHDAGLGLSLDQHIARFDVGSLRVSLAAVFPDGAFWPNHRDPGYACDYELVPPCEEAVILSPTRKSWLAWAALRLVPSPFEEIGFFAGVYGDRGNQFGRLAVPWLEEIAIERLLAWEATQPPRPDEVREAIRQETILRIEGGPLESRGDLVFIGLQGNYLFPRFSVELTAVIQFGRFEVIVPADVSRPAPEVMTPDVLAGAVDLGFSIPAHEMISVGGFLTFISGEPASGKGAPQGEFNAFISVAPWIRRSNLFFNSGLAHHFTARTASIAGLSGKGVLAGGLNLDLAPIEALGLELTAAALGAAAESSLTGGGYYGTEVDLEFRFYIADFLTAALEADALFGGDFLQERGLTLRVLAGLDLEF